MAKPRANFAAEPPGTLKLATVAARRIGFERAHEGAFGILQLLHLPKSLTHGVVPDAKPRL